MEGYKKRSIKKTEGKDRTYSPGLGLNTANMVMNLWVPLSRDILTNHYQLIG